MKDFAWGLGRRSNNGAEWLALIKGLEIARKEGTEDLVVFGDSMLVISEARNLTMKCKKPTIKIHHLFKFIVSEFNTINFLDLMRINKKNADEVATAGAALDCGTLVSNRQEFGNNWGPLNIDLF